MSTMTQMRAEGFLLASAINLLMDHPDDDFPGCCVINCGPCHALAWLRDNNPGWADDAVRANWDGRDEARYDWQTSDGGIDWPQLQAQWDLHKGCARVGDVWLPCDFEEES